MNIESTFLKGIISKVISKAIKKKLGGSDIDVHIEKLNVKVGDNQIFIQLGANAVADKKIIPELLKEALEGGQ